MKVSCRVFLVAVLGLVFAWRAHAADISHGASIYVQICSQCHGPDPRANENNIRAGANNPTLIQQQIATNPASVSS